MRIGVELAIKTPIDLLINQLEKYDSYPFDRIWVPDSSISEWEIFTTAGIVANIVKKARIGIGVTSPYHRNPATIAHAIATLDNISNGRIDFTIGRGSRPYLSSIDAVGTDEAVSEAIFIIKKLMHGEKVDFSGSSFNFEGVSQRVTTKQTQFQIYIASMSEYWNDIGLEHSDGLHVYSTNTELLSKVKSYKDRSSNSSFRIITTLGYVEPQEVREWWVSNFGKHYNLQKLSEREPGEASVAELESELTFSDTQGLQEQINKMQQYSVDELMIAYRRPEDLEAIASIVSKLDIEDN